MATVNQLKNRARGEEQRENWSGAIELYTQALEASRNGGAAFADLSLYNRIGDIYLRIGQKNTAVRYYEQAIERYAEQDLHASAIALCNKVLRIHPERSTVFLQLGRLHLATNLIADARAYYHKYAESMRERGTHEAALEALEELIDETGDAQTLDLWVSWLGELAEQDVALERVDEARSRLISHGIDPDQVLDQVRSQVTRGPDAVPAAEVEPDPLARAFLAMPDLEESGEEGESHTVEADDSAVVEEPSGGRVSSALEAAIPEPTPIEFGSVQWDDEAEELLSRLNQSIEETWVVYGEEASDLSPPSAIDVGPCPSLDLDAEVDEAVFLETPGAAGTDEPEGAASPDRRGEPEWTPPESDLDLEVEETPHAVTPGARESEADEADATSGEDDGPCHPSPVARELDEVNASVHWIEAVTPTSSLDDLELSSAEAWVPHDAYAFEPEPPLIDDEHLEPDGEEPAEPDLAPSLFVEPSPLPEEAAAEDATGADDPSFDDDVGALVEASEGTHGEVLPNLPGVRFATLSSAEEDEDVLMGDDAWAETARSAMAGAAAPGPESTTGAYIQPVAWPEPISSRDDHTAAVTEIAVEPTPAPDPEEGREILYDPAEMSELRQDTRTAMRDPLAETPPTLEEDPEDAFREWVQSASARVLMRALPELEKRSEADKAFLVIQRLSQQEDSAVEYRTRLVDYLEKLGRMVPAADACLALGAALELQDRPGDARRAYLRVLRIQPGHEAARAALDRLEDTASEDENEVAVEARPAPYMPDHVTAADSATMLDPVPRAVLPPGNGHTAAGRPYSGVAGGADASADFEQLLSEFRADLNRNPRQAGATSRTEAGASLKEMGRLDDAIRELQAAIREPAPPPLAFELLGEVFLEKGQGRIAARLLEKALGSLGHADRELMGVLYQLGIAYEALTDPDKALICYERIFSVDIDYRDIQERILFCSP